MNDRRNHTRVNESIVLEYSLLNENDFETVYHINISEVGLRFVAKKKFLTGDMLELRIKLALEDPLFIPALGRVIRVEKMKKKKGYFIITLLFFKIEPEHQKQLLLFVQNLEKRVYLDQRRSHIRVDDDNIRLMYCRIRTNDYEEAIQRINISGSGVRFMGSKGYREGTVLKLKIDLPTRPITFIPIIGEVVRIEKVLKKKSVYYRVALHYTEISKTDREKLIKYIFSRQREILRERKGRP